MNPDYLIFCHKNILMPLLKKLSPSLSLRVRLVFLDCNSQELARGVLGVFNIFMGEKKWVEIYECCLKCEKNVLKLTYQTRPK